MLKLEWQVFLNPILHTHLVISDLLLPVPQLVHSLVNLGEGMLCRGHTHLLEGHIVDLILETMQDF